jgi:hypothetical protein
MLSVSPAELIKSSSSYSSRGRSSSRSTLFGGASGSLKLPSLQQGHRFDSPLFICIFFDNPNNSSRYTEKKENKIFLIYKEIQSGAVAKSFMRKGS